MELNIQTNTSAHSGTEVIFRGTTLIARKLTSQEAVTGIPVFGYLISPKKPSSSWKTGEFSLLRSATHYRYHTISTGSLADDLLLLPWLLVDPARFELATFSMPLRRAPNCAMGPNYVCLLILHCSGPGGIRTLDLFSAIEARSQLRYRPLFEGGEILPVPRMIVKLLAINRNYFE